ncbi:hypothetical protein BCR44DRAFT_1242925 [Catenaria anguillulae PL171]|uniref:Lysosomal dipeptide transporter MFSD1 n=1 Tax=Catenaria anguillulae PL171 TaxID=765915 RepID=A0A1Y2HES6_9FUNG|nr:hypothetical protein BCR44DRAFT_1242925 [Catenaria anguillulae PL171]
MTTRSSICAHTISKSKILADHYCDRPRLRCSLRFPTHLPWDPWHRPHGSDAATVVAAATDHHRRNIDTTSAPNSRFLSPLSAASVTPNSPGKSSIHSRHSMDADRVSICTSVSGTPLLIHEHHHHHLHDPFHPMHASHGPDGHPHDAPGEQQASEMHELPQRGRVFGLGSSFWILCLLTVLLYGSVMPFIHISSDFIQSKWYPGDLPRAGALMSLPDLLCAILTPLLGFVVDKTGNPARFLPLSALLLAISHLLLFFTHLPPAPALVLLGIASATFAATLWPCVPMLVPDNALGTAYGAVTSRSMARWRASTCGRGTEWTWQQGRGQLGKSGCIVCVYIGCGHGREFCVACLGLDERGSGVVGAIWVGCAELVRVRERIHPEDEVVHVGERRRLLVDPSANSRLRRKMVGCITGKRW